MTFIREPFIQQTRAHKLNMACYPFLFGCLVNVLQMVFTFLNSGKVKINEEINCSTRKLYEIQISMLTNKFFLI